MKIPIALIIALALTLIAFFAMTFTIHAQGPIPIPRPIQLTLARSAPSITTTLYFPFITNFLPDSCAAIPNQSYGSVAIVGSPTDRPAAQHPDLNLDLRGYTITVQSKMLIDYGGTSDPKAPQLASLFSPARLPSFVNTYRVGAWDGGYDCCTGWDDAWPVGLLGMGTTQAEIISAPSSGYDIGLRPTGYDVMVLYAAAERITLKYTREDNVVYGYTIHIENVCTEPALLALYNTLNTQGRSRLPALWANQPLGRSRGTEIRVSIRDTGTFMDPRSRLDWWHGYERETPALSTQR